MDIKETNPSANIPKQQPDAPRGDRGNEKIWEPPQGEQGDEGDVSHPCRHQHHHGDRPRGAREGMTRRG